MYNPMTLTETSQQLYDHMNGELKRQFYEFDALADQERRFKGQSARVSLARAIDAMIEGRLNSVPEGEFFREIGKSRVGEAVAPYTDAQHIFVPFGLFQRDLTVASAASGGYLVATANARAADILRPWSVVINGGVIVEENQVGNVTIPKTTATSTIYWQSTEATQATASDPTVQQVAMSPKVAIGIINASRNFMVQANPEQWLRRELLRTAASAVDQAALNGSGALGQPLGVLGTTGLSTQSGTSLTWAGALAMKKNAALANAQDGSVSFISTPTVRALLEGREKASGNGGFIWSADRVADCPSFATTLMPAGAMISGPMSGITLAIWGQGIEIQVNPFDSTMFKRGAVQIRLLLAVDVAITVNPQAFTLASTIT